MAFDLGRRTAEKAGKGRQESTARGAARDQDFGLHSGGGTIFAIRRRVYFCR
jgi:hypothetical protein